MLDRRPYAFVHGRIFEDDRSEDKIKLATDIFMANVKPAIQRGRRREIIGQLLWIFVVISDKLMHYIYTGIHPHLLSSIEKSEKSDRTRHGPHVIVASEPTSELFLIHNMLKLRAYIRSN
jgi:hypothetical protein